MKNKAIWSDIKIKINKKELEENLETDILIIGGGITGLTLAYFLKDKDVTLIDKSYLGMGVTSKTTAKITYLQGTIYQQLEKNFNEEISKLYLKSQKEAISLIEKIIKENNISCDFNKVDSIIFTTEENNISKIKREKEILESFNIKTSNIENDNIKSGIKISDSYVFNPLKYLKGLTKIIEDKVDIYENILAEDITLEDNKYIVKTKEGIIKANKVVIACHYPFFLLPTLIPLKTYVKREYVNAAKVEKTKNYTAISIDDTLHSIRFYNDYLIYGSNKHKMTSKIDYKKNYDKSKLDFYNYFNIKPEYTWVNQDVMSNDNLPFIGKIKDNLYLATAYNAWGMTNGVIAAKLISDLIEDRENSYQKLFDPSRKNLPLYFNSLIGSFRYMKVYAEALFKRSNPSYIKIKGVVYGVYIDKFNKRHTIKLICPHMRCNLVFNKEEETWDCPCHGSRFDLDGNLIEGPAKKNLTKKDE